MKERFQTLGFIYRDWLRLPALESVLLSFVKSGPILWVQPIPAQLPLSPKPQNPFRTAILDMIPGQVSHTEYPHRSGMSLSRPSGQQDGGPGRNSPPFPDIA